MSICNVEMNPVFPTDLAPKIVIFGRGQRGFKKKLLVPGRDYKPQRERSSPPIMWDCALDYIYEHCLSSGVDPQRAWAALEDWIVVLKDRDISTLSRADGRTVCEYILSRGVQPSSARRIMTFGVAALNHARKEERIAKVPKFQMPGRSEPRVRWLSREEHRRVMQQPMSPRLKRFFLLAFHTGARSRAIEQLTWDRVDLARRTIDYRLQGVNHKNKRRAVVPISDALLPRLESMYARRADDYVIGLGARGACSTVYHEAKRVLKAAGINERGIARHVARHTFASWLLQADPPASIHQVAQLMGDTVAMVEKTYGHILPSHLMASVNRLH